MRSSGDPSHAAVPGGLREEEPEAAFDPTRFFEGRTRGWGIFEDRFGRMRRRFEIDMRGCWVGDQFRLEERFRFDDGAEESRIWHIARPFGGRFSATCDDCVGRLSGVCTADVIAMTYRFRLKLERGSIVVDLDDRIYRMASGRAVNRTTMRKWGLRLGELSLFFEPQGESDRASA